MMNKVANVVYAYSAKNDDELELKVGDKIEVIGVEEEGWWKGKLKGRIGVFPTNFVQVIETNPTVTTTTNNNNNNNNITSTTNKLTSIFGNKANKNSLSSNSLNSNNSNSSINNNNTNNNNNNITMNNTQLADSSNHTFADDGPSITTNDKRPKPIRGMGYGDIFAVAGSTKPKLLPAESITTSSTTGTGGVSTSERLNSIGSIVSNTLQKQIPKKPPPPAPKTDSDQAPALPPKPINQFSPLLQQQQLSRPLTQQPHQQQTTTQQVREQAKVIYAYEPSNEDELAMEVGDIINIIKKDIEDVGWWKGELRGKIGVFPDNFVELIETTELPTSTNLDWHNRSNTISSQQQNPANNFNQHSIDNRINNKPIFASTLKDFSKELENNLLEKQQHNIGNNSAASLLSAKRNKLQQLSSLTASLDSSSTSENGVRDNPPLEHSSSLTNPTSPSKLNHITVNRAKGPSRKPPTNILNKKNQVDQLSNTQRELSSNGTDEHFHGSLSIDSSPSSSNKTMERTQSTMINETMSSLPIVQQQLLLSNSSLTTNSYLQSNKSNTTTPAILTNQSLATKSIPTIDQLTQNQSILPKTSQRLGQSSMVNNSPLNNDKTKLTTPSNTTTPSNATTPSWMVELKKAHAEKKRDSPAVIASNNISTHNTILNSLNTTNTIVPPPSQVLENEKSTPTLTPALEKKSSVEDVQATETTLSSAQYDNMLGQMSRNVIKEINELKVELKLLREDFMALGDLKSVLDTMRTELKACQSATENQKRYIKDLVNNLADERKKIASMQEEIDRNLK